MGELVNPLGEGVAKGSAGEAGAGDLPRVRRCKRCLGTVPAPRRKYCGARCARQAAVALNDWRRKHGRHQ
jgi:hypothetical protein